MAMGTDGQIIKEWIEVDGGVTVRLRYSGSSNTEIGSSFPEISTLAAMAKADFPKMPEDRMYPGLVREPEGNRGSIGFFVGDGNMASGNTPLPPQYVQVHNPKLWASELR